MLAHVMKNTLGVGVGLMVLIVAAIVFAWPVAAQSAPPTPENLKVIDKTHRSVTLGWDDPDDASIVGYRILRRQIPIMASGYFKEIEKNTNSTSTEYTDTEDYLEPNIRYVYRIQSVNASGDLSDQSNYVRVRVPRWQAPQNLSAEVVDQDDGSYDIKLIWDDESPINGIAWVSRFRISRRIAAPWVEEKFTELTEIQGWRGGYTDSGVVWPREYEYKVEAKSKNAYGLPGTVSIGEAGSVSEPSGGDFPKDTSTIGYVLVDGDAAAGTLSSTDSNRDLDYFRIDLDAEQTYTIRIEGNPESAEESRVRSPQVELLRLNASGDAVELSRGNTHISVIGVGLQTDSSVVSRISGGQGRLAIEVYSAGTYFLKVKGVKIGSSPPGGDYVVSADSGASGGSYSEDDSFDFSNDVDSIGYVLVGDPATGTISSDASDTDVDYMRTDLDAGQTYTIQMKGDPRSLESRRVRNPFVTLLRLNSSREAESLPRNNSHVALIGEGHQDEDGLTSGEGAIDTAGRIEIEVYTSGKYFLALEAVSSDLVPIASGDYRVKIATGVGGAKSVSEPSGGDLPADISTGGYALVDEEEASGRISPDGPLVDIDYFRTYLRAGQTYRIEMKGNPESVESERVLFPFVTLLRLNEAEEAENLPTGNSYISLDGDGFQWPGSLSSGFPPDNVSGRLEIEAHSSGIYFLMLQATHHGDITTPFAGGDYTVEVVRTDDD